MERKHQSLRTDREAPDVGKSRGKREKADMIRFAQKIVEDYLEQNQEHLATAARVLRERKTGSITTQQAGAQLGQLGYTIEGNWPCYFADILQAAADDWFSHFPLEERALGLARALDAGNEPELAAVLRRACPAESFDEAYKATIDNAELVNEIWGNVPVPVEAVISPRMLH